MWCSWWNLRAAIALGGVEGVDSAATSISGTLGNPHRLGTTPLLSLSALLVLVTSSVSNIFSTAAVPPLSAVGLNIIVTLVVYRLVFLF